eukprot:6106374-Pyramimonas_sp.AAC.1
MRATGTCPMARSTHPASRCGSARTTTRGRSSPRAATGRTGSWRGPERRSAWTRATSPRT